MKNIYLSDSTVDLKRRILEAGECILAFGACGPENAQFHQARYKLYSIASSDVSVSDASVIAADADVLALARDVFPISCDAGVLEECRIAENLLGESNLTFGKIYRAYHGQIYQSLMEDELTWLEREGQLHSCTESTYPPGATQCCRVGYIGGGALPLPAMLLAQRLGYQVVVLDPHARSAAFATELIAKVGLDHLVRMICVDGSKYDFSDCDLVFVSNWIADKQPLLRHLRKFTNIQHFIFRSAPCNSLGFIINDMIDPNRVCEHGFRFRYQTEKRPGLSLISLIFSLLRQSEATDSTETICRADDKPAKMATSRKRLVADSITDLIGNTPILKLNPAKTSLTNIDLYAKLEHLNPFGSIKDRTAWAMLRPHLGTLQSSNKQLLELSSGNAARALQAVASIHGSALETITNRIRIQEMRRMLVVQGAKVSPMARDVDPTDAMAALLYVDARACEQRDRYLYTDQYRNPNNDCTHYATTAREILEDLGPVDYFFAPVGTAGSSIGISRRLREANEKLKVSGIVSTKDSAIPGIRHMDEMFYVGPFEEQKYDQLVGITASEALDGMLALIRDYGVMAGPSSGATYLAALRYLRAIDAKQTERKSAVIIVCDRVELYLSWIEQMRPALFEGYETPEAEHATVANSAALGGLEVCGIAGFVGRETPATLRIGVVEDMVRTGAMQRRGPDSRGTVIADERVVLGNTRLRVNDMRNSEADMPMQSADGMLTLTFNGKIYNHIDLRRLCPDYHFRTKSDAESLLAIYQRHGLDMLSMLEGMFAFCLHDRWARRTLLAVDPTGQKPLYYTLGTGDELYFASDIETILRVPHLNFSWDREGLAQAAGIMFVFGPHTHIREIKKLEAGCYLVVEQGERPRHRRYHKIVIRDESQQDVTAVTERIRDAVAAGCTRCFDLEVPYAYLLSGGIDSSSVVARARSQGLELHTYAIGFPESGLRTGAIMHNEFSYSRLVAEAFGTEHREIEVTSQTYCEAMDRWWSLCCEPNGAPEAVCLFMLFEQIAGDGHRVAFCGSGPDEVFDGYSHGHRLKTTPSRLLAGAYFDYFNAVGDIDLGQLMPEVDARAAFISAVQPYLDLYAHDTQDSQQLICLLDYHGECVVSEYRQIDMASMAHSIEVRNPLADQQVIQSAFSFLPRLKHYEDSEKWIFKQAMSPWLPGAISSRKKIGFPVPQMVYASPEFEVRMESSLESDSGLDKLGLFDMAYLRRAWRERGSHGYDIFYRLHGMDVIARRHSSYLSRKEQPPHQ